MDTDPFFENPVAFLEALLGTEEDETDPDWMPATKDRADMEEKVYRDLRPFVLLVERYRLPARQSAMLWNASLLCNGNNDPSKLITHTTILNLQARYGKEKLEQRKLDQQPYVSLAIDGKEVHEPFGNNKTQKHNFATVVGLEVASEENPEPEEDYAGHFK